MICPVNVLAVLCLLRMLQLTSAHPKPNADAVGSSKTPRIHERDEDSRDIQTRIALKRLHDEMNENSRIDDAQKDGEERRRRDKEMRYSAERGVSTYDDVNENSGIDEFNRMILRFYSKIDVMDGERTRVNSRIGDEKDEIKQLSADSRMVDEKDEIKQLSSVDSVTSIQNGNKFNSNDVNNNVNNRLNNIDGILYSKHGVKIINENIDKVDSNVESVKINSGIENNVRESVKKITGINETDKSNPESVKVNSVIDENGNINVYFVNTERRINKTNHNNDNHVVVSNIISEMGHENNESNKKYAGINEIDDKNNELHTKYTGINEIDHKINYLDTKYTGNNEIIHKTNELDTKYTVNNAIHHKTNELNSKYTGNNEIDHKTNELDTKYTGINELDHKMNDLDRKYTGINEMDHVYDGINSRLKDIVYKIILNKDNRIGEKSNSVKKDFWESLKIKYDLQAEHRSRKKNIEYRSFGSKNNAENNNLNKLKDILKRKRHFKDKDDSKIKKRSTDFNASKEIVLNFMESNSNDTFVNKSNEFLKRKRYFDNKDVDELKIKKRSTNLKNVFNLTSSLNETLNSKNKDSENSSTYIVSTTTIATTSMDKHSFKVVGVVAKAAAILKDSMVDKMATGSNMAATGRACIHKYNTDAQTARLFVDAVNSGTSDDDIEYVDYEDHEPVLSNETVPGLGSVWVEHCARRGDLCYAFWTEDQTTGQFKIMGQGCWESSDRQESCSSSGCVSARAPPPARPDTKFCCCTGDYCNSYPASLPVGSIVEIEDIPLSPAPAPAHPLLGYGVGALTAIGCLLMAAILAACLLRKRAHKHAPADAAELGGALEAGGPGFSCSATCVDNLKLHDNIGSGRHAQLWRGSLGGVPVAVKALPASHTALWTRERDLYCLPHMRHANLLAYLGCDTRPTLDGGPEHLLVLQLAPLGSLRQYLSQHTLHWEAYTNMALGVASALAHLHTHIDKDNQYKPCIVHRDVNSSNVVVRADLTCCLADLGLAMSLPSARKRPQVQHQHRIQEAGTLRYLAPEVLEGVLDLRRCAAALRAVDVYALALVLWELLSRCSPLHRPPGPAPYAPPFMAQVGENPTLEQMQVVVARRKARPLFSPRLVGSRGARLARDTCEDCWDHDAEARLTAVCVVERLTELRSLKPAPSPTINSNDLRPPANQDGAHIRLSPNAVDDKNSNLSSNSVPGAALTDHLLPLQPHQGRNPCLERNLATAAGPGDRLIDKSTKDNITFNHLTTTNTYGTNDYIRIEQSNSQQDANIYNTNEYIRSEQVNVQHTQDFSRPEENLPVSAFTSIRNSRYLNSQSNEDDEAMNDVRTHVRPVTPLGYVQNDVSGDFNAVSEHTVLKETNLKRQNNFAPASNWSAKGLRKLLDTRVFKRRNNVDRPSPLETEVNLVLANGKPINNGRFKTSVVVNDVKCNKDGVDRPCSLPGLECASKSNIGTKMWKDNTTCTLSPPNQTVSLNMMTKEFDANVMGYKEFPVSECNVVPSSQVYAVIVPKATSTCVVNNVNDTNKRHSCDESFFNNAATESSSLLAEDDAKICYRNSYSGENCHNQKMGNFCQYNSNDQCNIDGSLVDYSSNSEDEHMLLLAENNGSKITMRQRFEVGSKEGKRRKVKSGSQDGGGLTKMAAGSFTSLCNKYAPKARYESLDNESSETLLNEGDSKMKRVVNDVVLKKTGSSLSLCKNGDVSIEALNSDDDDDDVTIKEDVIDVCAKVVKVPRPLSIKQNLSRQHSLELVSEIFASCGDLGRMRDPAGRIKTPGDVPPSVRRTRGGAARVRRSAGKIKDNRLSLYDDRMMFGNSL